MKKKFIFGLGAVVAGIASAVAVKLMMDKDYHTVPSLEDDDDEDRGVAPVGTEEDLHEDKDDEVQNVKADAINHGYKLIDY